MGRWVVWVVLGSRRRGWILDFSEGWSICLAVDVRGNV